MTKVISFTSAKFDPTKEPVNPINPIAGQSLLLWISNYLAGRVITKPDTEDWGWYIEFKEENQKYMIGASGEPEEGVTDVRWTIQVHKLRNFWQKLTGQNKTTDEDAIARLVEKIIRSEPSFHDIECAFEP